MLIFERCWEGGIYFNQKNDFIIYYLQFIILFVTNLNFYKHVMRYIDKFVN